MKQLRNGVSFKSIPTMWEIEENGVKPNTIRMVTTKEYEWLAHEKPAEIWITNTETGYQFIRQITHTLKVFDVLGQVQILINWKHE